MIHAFQKTMKSEDSVFNIFFVMCLGKNKYSIQEKLVLQ